MQFKIAREILDLNKINIVHLALAIFICKC